MPPFSRVPSVTSPSKCVTPTAARPPGQLPAPEGRAFVVLPNSRTSNSDSDGTILKDLIMIIIVVVWAWLLLFFEMVCGGIREKVRNPILTFSSEIDKSLEFESVLLSSFELFHFLFNRFEKALRVAIDSNHIVVQVSS